MRVPNLSLGVKLNIALLVFLLVLGAATSAIIIYGFNRTQDHANERSREALEEEGKLALQALVGGATESGGLQFESAAEIGQRAARYMETVREQSPKPFESELARTEGGLYYRSDPARAADLIVLDHMPLDDPAVQDELAYAVALDTISSVLFEGFEDEVGGRNFDPNAIAFIGVNGVGHIYPPRGIHELIPADLDTSNLMQRVGPEENPLRRTLWTAPYEDVAGQGLVVTAETPVYEGDTFRGAIQVDLLIRRLIDQLNGIRPTPGGFAFYVDTNGDLLESDHYELLSREAQDNARLASILDGMKSGDGGGIIVDTVLLEGQQFFVAHAPMLSLGGSIAVAAPVDEVTGQAAEITAGIDEEGNRTFWIMLASMGGLFVAGLAGATWLNRRVLIGPIQRLAAATRAVAGGDLATTVALDRTDELGALGESFNTMVEQLRESERTLEARVAARTSELTALLEVSRQIAAEVTTDDLAQTLVRVASELFETTGASVASIDQDGVATHLGSNNPKLVERGVKRGFVYDMRNSGPIWEELRRGRGVLIGDIRADSDHAAAYRTAMGAEMDGLYRDVRSWMAVPMEVKDRVVGWIVVSHNVPDRYTEDDLNVARAMANQAAVAIENARLFADVQHAASLEERQRLARELHDSVSQALYGIALGARTAQQQLEREPAKAAEPIEYVLSLAEAGLAEMRALIFELRPESLESEGVVAALQKQAAATEARFGVQLELDLCDEPEIPIEHKEVLYRIGQEALHNVVKHAKAQHVSLALRSANGGLTLEVRDDGVGFDPDADHAGHLGLRSMRERAAKIGATLTVESTAGVGTLVRVRTG